MSVSKKEVVARIKTSGIIPVFYHADMDVLMKILRLNYQCGLRIFEFMHQRDNKGLRFFEHLVGRRTEFPDLILGVGTVLDATMTERYIHAGADFISSPFLRPDMGKVCGQNSLLWMPGCTSPDEIDKAKAAGAAAINVVPGNVLGCEFIATTSKQHPDLCLIPSGVTDLKESSLARWFEAGSSAVKIGNQFFTKEEISAKDWSRIERNISTLLKDVKKVQSALNITT
jgi:2-dehydro-3-deoxyphosphogluconate aldolase/(4S)-4-hydroxy-2-oxoglutarate aldolase